MKILSLVMTHPGGMEAYARHRHLWEHHKSHVITYATAGTKGTIGETIYFGSEQHHGLASLDRFRYLMRTLANLCDERGYEYVLISEYDSFCLEPGIPGFMMTDCLWGNLFHERPNTKFVSTVYLHPPLFSSAKIVRRIADGCDKHAGISCDGFWDRWLGHVCQSEQIPMIGFGPMGFSTNTIDDSNIDSAVEAVIDGAIMIHGVKDAKALKAITEAYSLATCQ